MKKQSKLLPSPSANQGDELDMGRGKINNNFLAALVTSCAYQQQVVKNKKGKGAYLRKNKHSKKGQESYLIAA